MSEDIKTILQTALERQAARSVAYVPPDYANTHKLFKQQKSALTRAINSGDWRKVLLTCRRTVQQWQSAPFNGHWPDDWARWQIALDDAMGGRYDTPRLEDLI